jgi:hypothetical protein
MPRNFNLKLPGSVNLAELKNPQVLMRVLLGALLVANLVAATFAFHVFEDSPEKVASQVQSARQQLVAAIKKLSQSRLYAAKLEKGQDEGAKFINTYMTSRRATYSTIIGEINEMALNAAMTPKDALIHLDAVEGSPNLDVMTVTASFDGPYRNLLAFINSIDKSKHFLIIDSLGATPGSNDRLQITIKFCTFVKEDQPA